MAARISRDTPLFELTLRKYERPYKLSQREAARRLCLCLGLLQPGDSRDVVVDILLVLLTERARRRAIGAEQLARRVLGLRKRSRQRVYGVATPNIRRQLARLKDLLLVEKTEKGYRITEWMSLQELFATRVQRVLLADTPERLQEYLALADSLFAAKHK